MASVDDAMVEAASIRERLSQDARIGRYVRTDVDMPGPYVGEGEVRLFIIGQDPTVQSEESISSIGTVLDLARCGHLRDFVCEICEELGVGLDNVYATNACKNHFASKPIEIARKMGVDVLEGSAALWLPLLRKELTMFPSAAVISLGQPLLSMLVRPEFSRKLRHYWGYQKNWEDGLGGPMSSVLAEESTVDREFFPLMHQPTWVNDGAGFYRTMIGKYAAHIRGAVGWSQAQD